MELKKCKRCGCFFSSTKDVCTKCEVKDKLEMDNLRNYLNNLDSGVISHSAKSLFDNNSVNKNFSDINSCIDTISVNTGISVKNLNRYFSTDAFLPEANFANSEYPNFTEYAPSNKITTKVVRKNK